MNYSGFSRIIKQGIKKEGISLRELARRSSLDVSFLSKILSGNRNPPSSEEDIKKIAKGINVMPEKLIISSGRIPSSMMKIFENEDFIDNLMRGGAKNSDIPDRTAEMEEAPLASIGDFTGQGHIEDELL